MRVLPIEFLGAISSSDGQGGRVGEMGVLYSCQAEYKPVKINRWLQAQQPDLPASHVFVMWRDITFTPAVDMQIRFQGQELTIQSVTPYDEAMTRLSITATGTLLLNG